MKALKEKQIIGTKLYSIKGGYQRPSSPTGYPIPPDGPPIYITPQGSNSSGNVKQ